MSKIYLRFAPSFGLIFSLFAVSLPSVGYAQTATQAAVSSDLQKSLATIEEKLETRRKELGIPGLSLAIVKDGEVVLMKGYGYKDFEKQVPVTPDTQFAIGSSSKAFTALSVVMSQDEGKLNLDDNPKKHLPYFKINDTEIDQKITVRDLLSHSSGLNRTDLAWYAGKLSREEVIRVAGEAKPIAKLREKFLYQNVMFAAAGEIVAQVQKQPWERFVAQRIFKPLGMMNSNLSIKEMEQAKDYSFGYEYNPDTKETKRQPFKQFPNVAPAGAINSSAKDMAQWLKFMLGGGSVNGKRLVSEESFAELVKPQMKVAGKTSYGLGWMLEDWNGMKVVHHGGSIDGFNAMVAMIPEKKLGFVMLTNVSRSPLTDEMRGIVWNTFFGKPQTSNTIAAATGKPENEIGKYHFEAAGMDVEIVFKDGKLVALVPGQPNYVLENVGARKYKLTGAPDGFFVTFKDGELYLEQPQGNYTLPRIKADGKTEAKRAGTAKELIGKYESEQAKGRFVEVREADGKIVLNVEGQQPYALAEKEKDLFSMSPLPDSYSLKTKRDASGKITGIAIAQPEGEFAFRRVEADAANAPKISIDEVMSKTLNALGGEAMMRKLSSRVMTFDLDFESQGIKGFGTTYEKAPGMTVTETTMTALGKPMATAREYFDGTQGGEETSFSPAETYTGKRLEDVRVESDFHGFLNWKNGLKSAEVRGVEKVDSEDAYVVVIQPEKASELKYFISTKTFLPLKKTSLVVSSTSQTSLPVSEFYADYRTVDGVMIPFKIKLANLGMGNVILRIKEVKHNQAIDDKMFKPKSETKAVGKN
ncbi:MAG: serine hydrolase [Acidobacteria bacterium]|nr:serine hydrolase [Acidobacteriota bacterium]MCA1637261.1 serine hydrolase [Acidobacteriota bacterium]